MGSVKTVTFCHCAKMSNRHSTLTKCQLQYIEVSTIEVMTILAEFPSPGGEDSIEGATNMTSLQTQPDSKQIKLSPPPAKPERFGTSAQEIRRVWTRWEDGGCPVTVWENSEVGTVYELRRETGSEFYHSTRKLLRAITGRECKLSFERYFRIDEPTRRAPTISVFDLGRLSKLRRRQRRQKKTQIGGGFSEHRSKEGLRLTAGANETRVRQLVEQVQAIFPELEPAMPRPLGIDLAKRGHEVRKLLFAGFRGLMASKGYDPEEVLQEIFAGILRRNAGKCPWDARKSTFGFYCTMIIRCVLTNYHRKMSRKQDREALELDEGSTLPMSSPQSFVSASTDVLARESLERWLAVSGTPEAELALRLLPLVEQGMGRREIVSLTGLKETLVSRGMAYLRERARSWADEIGCSASVRSGTRAARVSPSTN